MYQYPEKHIGYAAVVIKNIRHALDNTFVAAAHGYNKFLSPSAFSRALADHEQQESKFYKSGGKIMVEVEKALNPSGQKLDWMRMKIGEDYTIISGSKCKLVTRRDERGNLKYKVVPV
ncbi:hypothetical protein CkP1_0196 [Citrobacter phage CkP1]|nr:hypothetical protein CkP1_0196 [Citrobacter phage CkP1]